MNSPSSPLRVATLMPSSIHVSNLQHVFPCHALPGIENNRYLEHLSYGKLVADHLVGLRSQIAQIVCRKGRDVEFIDHQLLLESVPGSLASEKLMHADVMTTIDPNEELLAFQFAFLEEQPDSTALLLHTGTADHHLDILAGALQKRLYVASLLKEEQLGCVLEKALCVA